MIQLQEKDFSTTVDFSTWIKLFKLISAYSTYLWSLFFVMIVVAGVDVLFPLMNKFVVDTYILPQTTKGIHLFVGGYVLLVIVQSFNIFLLIQFAGKIYTKACYTIRKRAFQHLQELSFSFYDKTPVGWIMSRLTSDCEKLSDILSWGLVDVVWGCAMMFGIAIVMLYLNWKLALISLSVIPPLMVLSIWFQQKILRKQRDIRKLNSTMTASLNEGITGAKTTKLLVREEEQLREFCEITSRLKMSSIRSASITSIYLPLVLLFGSVGTSLALLNGGILVDSSMISYGTLVAFISYTVQFFNPILELARILSELQSAQASAERIFSLIETKPEIYDDPRIVGSNTSLNQKPQGTFELRNVDFWYNPKTPVLSNFSCTFQAGQSIGLVGHTGSGKSTIVNLLCRFYEPTNGLILLDGKDYRSYPLSWLQSRIGYVLQTPHLFRGTIMENIKYGKLTATDDQVYDVTHMLSINDWISQLEKGYDTDVGEGGSLLSRGQKQLIAFARALITDPLIFIFDEATSSIDTDTEQKVQGALHSILGTRTSIVIAHRLSTIKKMDRILFLHDGVIQEDGNHHELLKKKGIYHTLYKGQFVEERENELVL